MYIIYSLIYDILWFKGNLEFVIFGRYFFIELCQIVKLYA